MAKTKKTNNSDNKKTKEDPLLSNMMSFDQMKAEAKRRAKARKNNLKKGN